jgi:glucose-1-phosphate adenylyltransferase
VVHVEDGRSPTTRTSRSSRQSDLVTNEVFVFTRHRARPARPSWATRREDGLSDLGDALLPRLVASGRAREHRFEDYWRDLGTIPAYWQAHMDLLEDEPPFDPGRPGWRLTTRGGNRPPARIRAGATVEDSLLSPSSVVAGRVCRSVLSPHVVVEAGAEVHESVLLHGAIVRSGARVRRAVLDQGVEVCAGVTLGGDGEIALVGRDERVDTDLPAGGRQPAPAD